jgi:hypothetical protein
MPEKIFELGVVIFRRRSWLRQGWSRPRFCGSHSAFNQSTGSGAVKPKVECGRGLITAARFEIEEFAPPQFCLRSSVPGRLTFCARPGPPRYIVKSKSRARRFEKSFAGLLLRSDRGRRSESFITNCRGRVTSGCLQKIIALLLADWFFEPIQNLKHVLPNFSLFRR